jgi:imidazolonepropionase-like amidohydrolase
VQLRDGKFGALVSIGQSSDWLHWLDAIKDRKLEFTLRVPMTRELDLYEIKKELGERHVRVVLEPEITLHPGTMRQRNLPMELAQAGARLVLIPRNDTVADHESWLRHVGEMIRAGLDREAALASVTLEGAKLLGLEKELGSLDQGKRADLAFYDGDPFEPTTRIQAVMLGGEFVSGEVKE